MNSLANATHAETAEHKRAFQAQAPSRRKTASEAFPWGAPAQRKPACACGGGCPRCQAAAPALKISEPDDPYEREADRVADQVMRMPDPPAQTRKENPGAKIKIQRIASGDGGGHNAPQSMDLDPQGGQPLSPATRNFMEPRFGVAFSHVRLHADPRAQQMAERMQARAFTSGHHIWLGKGESEHDTPLMAHELTHVVQQERSAAGAGPQLIQRNGPKTFVGTENTCVAFEDRELNISAGEPLSETTTPGGRVVPGTRGAHQNCAGASMCGRQEYINWPFLGLEAADHQARPQITADWDAANYFVPAGCAPVSCSGISLNATRCSLFEREVIVFLYRWPAGVLPGTSTVVYQSDFHMIGRTPSTLPMAWESKMDRRERVVDIRDPWQSLYDAYPHTRRRDREIRQHCFCCDCGRVRTV